LAVEVEEREVERCPLCGDIGDRGPGECDEYPELGDNGGVVAACHKKSDPTYTHDAEHCKEWINSQ
jgi:hypothetical protein